MNDKEKSIYACWTTNGTELRMEGKKLPEGAQMMEPCDELNALLHGEVKSGLCGGTYVTLLPLDDKDEIHALIGVDVSYTHDDKLPALLNGIETAGRCYSGIETIGIYNRTNDQFFVTNAPYGKKLFNNEAFGYDQVLFHQFKEYIADALLERTVENQEALRERFGGTRSYDRENADQIEEVLSKDLVKKMFEQGITDVRELDMAVVLDADRLIGEHVFDGDILAQLVRGDMERAADQIFDSAAESIGLALVVHDDRVRVQEKSWEKINEGFGWRVELSKAIKAADAKTVTVKVSECEAFSEVKVDVDDFLRRLTWDEPVTFTYELEKAGLSFKEALEVPNPRIEAVTYRGKDIWTRDVTGQSIEHPKPVSLREAGIQARETAEHLRNNAPSKTTNREAR